MLKNIVQPDKPQMATWGTRIARWMTKPGDTRSEYVILTASLRQQRLRERASVLRYTYIAYLVLKKFVIVMYSIIGIYSLYL